MGTTRDIPHPYGYRNRTKPPGYSRIDGPSAVTLRHEHVWDHLYDCGGSGLCIINCLHASLYPVACRHKMECHNHHHLSRNCDCNCGIPSRARLAARELNRKHRLAVPNQLRARVRARRESAQIRGFTILSRVSSSPVGGKMSLSKVFIT